MTAPRILALAGGRTAASLIGVVARGAIGRGAQVSHVDLAAAPLPLFTDTASSSQAGVAAGLAPLQAELARHEGLILVAPEVGGAVAPLVINALAWLATAKAGVLTGKIVVLAAPAPYGGTGLKALAQLSGIVASHGGIVLPYPIAVAQASLAGDLLQDRALETVLEQLGGTLADFLGRQRPRP